jgi:hypothetical protein
MTAGVERNGASHEVATVRVKGEGHGRPRREAYFRRGLRKLQGGRWDQPVADPEPEPCSDSAWDKKLWSEAVENLFISIRFQLIPVWVHNELILDLSTVCAGKHSSSG